MNIVFKTIIAAFLISIATSLSKNYPKLAGFIVALPIISIIAVLISYLEFGDNSGSIKFAKSIFYAVPISSLFFIPFVFAGKFQLSFWTSFSIGIGLLIIGFFIHQLIPG